MRRLIRGERYRQLGTILTKTHAADIGYLLHFLTAHQRVKVLDLVSEPQQIADILAELDETVLRDVLITMPDERLVDILLIMPSDEMTDILNLVGQERKDELMKLMPAEELSEAHSLLGYLPQSAGGLMSTEYLALSKATTAQNALDLVRQNSRDAEMVFYVYVVNDHGHLVGVLSLRNLVQAPAGQAIGEFMTTEVVRVFPEVDQEEVARLVARYNLLALPVVDSNNQLLGIVTVDDVIDVIRYEATEDMLKMAGVAGARVAADAPPLGSIRRRIPGLFPAFVAGLLGIAVVSSYEDDLRRVLALACFMPMIMGMAKTIGTQSSTLITRGLALGKFEFAVMGRVVFKEMLIGVVAGVVYGSVSGLLAAAYFEHGIRDSWFFGLTIGSAVVTSMTVAAILGATIPLLFERVGWDPASANSPFVSTTIDVTAIWIYLMTGSVLTLL